MKNMAALVRHYDTLTPDERIRLALDALLRDDEQEQDRLWRTCPRRTYEQVDAAFLDRWEAAREAMLVFLGLWANAYWRFQLADFVADVGRNLVVYFAEGYVVGANNAWRAAGKDTPYFALADGAW